MRRLVAPLARCTAAHAGSLAAPSPAGAIAGVAAGARFKSALARTAPRRTVQVGDPIPSVDLHKGFPPTMVPLGDYCKGKKVVLVPGYIAKESELKAKDVSEVLVYCVNDAAVMKAWAADQGCDKEGLVKMYGDPRSELTEALGLVLDHPGPVSVLGGPRCKRFSMLVEDGIIKTINVAEGPEDPAGDSKPDVSLVGKMLEDLA